MVLRVCYNCYVTCSSNFNEVCLMKYKENNLYLFSVIPSLLVVLNLYICMLCVLTSSTHFSISQCNSTSGNKLFMLDTFYSTTKVSPSVNRHLINARTAYCPICSCLVFLQIFLLSYSIFKVLKINCTILLLLF